jgi:Lrp/AsnC family transcriptional regulator
LKQATRKPTPPRRTVESGNFDEIDRQILDLLQESDRPVATLAEEIGLSQTPCWRRIRKLEEAGVIRGRVTLVDPIEAGVGLTVFIAVTAPRHEISWLNQFRELIESIPEVVEAYRLTGSTDYILKVLVPDIQAYDEVYKSLIERLDFSQISASIAMEELKFTTAVPTAYL